MTLLQKYIIWSSDIRNTKRPRPVAHSKTDIVQKSALCRNVSLKSANGSAQRVLTIVVLNIILEHVMKRVVPEHNTRTRYEAGCSCVRTLQKLLTKEENFNTFGYSFHHSYILTTD